MNRKNPKPYLLLLAVLLMLISIPSIRSEKIRGFAISVFAPAWEYLAQPHFSNSIEEEILKLRLENQLLKSDAARLKEIFQHERHLMLQLSGLYQEERHSEEIRSLVKQHLKNLKQLIASRLQAIPARVVFRSPSSWSSSLWINVGENTNTTIGRLVIAKNSPVLVGNSLVGVVDYVGKNQCRVRLITDSGLTPSVRVIRGDLQRNLVFDNIAFLIESIAQHQSLFSPVEREVLKSHLYSLKDNLQTEHQNHTWHLAKGELQGSSKPLWRAQGSMLQGIGFNYDFADDYGPARDLRTGAPVNASPKDQESNVPILKIQDLLVTTGMDGVFPAGLSVAEVVSIKPLKEGDYYYELEARPTAGNLQELSLVYVIPPLGYDSSDQPPPVGL